MGVDGRVQSERHSIITNLELSVPPQQKVNSPETIQPLTNRHSLANFSCLAGKQEGFNLSNNMPSSHIKRIKMVNSQHTVGKY